MKRIFEVNKFAFLPKVRSEMFLRLNFRILESLKLIFQIIKFPTSKISLAGFTLVEILVAISILSIIGAVSIPNLQHFNEAQILQNTTNDLVRTLRDAQSAANSHVQCDSVLRGREWSVNINTSRDTYELEVSCYNPASTGALPGPVGRYSPAPAVINGVDFAVATIPSGNCNTPRVAFASEYMPYDQDRFSNISFICSGVARTDNQMQITLTKKTTCQTINIDKGGAINATAPVTPCP